MDNEMIGSTILGEVIITLAFYFFPCSPTRRTSPRREDKETRSLLPQPPTGHAVNPPRRFTTPTLSTPSPRPRKLYLGCFLSSASRLHQAPHHSSTNHLSPITSHPSRCKREPHHPDHHETIQIHHHHHHTEKHPIRDRAPPENTELPQPKFLTDHRRRYYNRKEQNTHHEFRRLIIPPKKAGEQSHQQRRNRSPDQRNPKPPPPPMSPRSYRWLTSPISPNRLCSHTHHDEPLPSILKIDKIHLEI